MKMLIKKFNLRILILIGCLVLGNGCWDRKELKTQGLVAGIGVDRRVGEKGSYQYTFQVIKPGEVGQPKGKSGGGGGGEAPVWVGTSMGQTPYQAGRNISFQISRRLFFAHNQVFIIGKEAAKQGVRPILDLEMRFFHSRSVQDLVIAKGTANEILEVTEGMENIPVFEITGMLKSSINTSEAFPVSVQDFFGYLVSKTRAPVAPQIEVVTTGEKKKVQLSGTAVFKKDRWIGELNYTETRGLLWILGRVNRGIINIPSRQGDEIAAVEIEGAGSKVQPKVTNHKVTIRIEINTEGDLNDVLVPENLSVPEKLHQLEKLVAASIRSEILAAWQKARKLKADIFGFGEAVHRKNPRRWKSLESKWDQVFPDINLETKIKVTLKNTGEILQPAIPQ